MNLARLAALAFVLCAGPAAAQDWPSKPIRLIVPFPPAGVTDILGRLAAERLGAQLKQSIVVENRPGASGHIGAQQVAKSTPDGYTIMAGTIGIHAAYGTYRKLPYDPATELQPIMILGEAPNIVVVPAASPYRAFGDLLADVRANPGKVHNGTSGPGSSTHMVAVLFELQANAKLSHIPYKGTTQATTDVMSGQIPMMFSGVNAVAPQIREGKLLGLAVGGTTRSPLLPNVPTMAEAGVPGYEFVTWMGLFAPLGTPREVVMRLNAEVARALAAPDLREKLAAQAIEIKTSTPEELGALTKARLAQMAKLIKDAGIVAE